MAKNQGIVRLRGSIDGVTYTEGVHGRLSRSKSSLNKAKMDANPKYHMLRQLQKELGMYSKFGASLRSGFASELQRVKAFRGVPRLNQLLHAIKEEDALNRVGKRNVLTGLGTLKGRQHLTGFDFYGKTTVLSLLNRDFELDFTAGTATILQFEPEVDVQSPAKATHIGFKLILMGMSITTVEISTVKSAEVVVPMDQAPTDLILSTNGLLSVHDTMFGIVQLLFYQEINGFKELIALDSAALTLLTVELGNA